MMPATPDPTPRDDRPPCRLRLRSLDAPSGRHLDGGWWPHSRDLAQELPPLVTELSRTGFTTVRVVYRLHGWTETTRRMTIAGRRISLGGYRKQADDTIALLDGSGQRRLELLVIPPGTDPAVADRALTQAALDGDPESGAEVLLRAQPA